MFNFPVAIVDCGPWQPIPSHHRIWTLISPQYTTTFNSTVTIMYGCNEGYLLPGNDGNITVSHTCTSGGTWSDDTIKCCESIMVFLCNILSIDYCNCIGTYKRTHHEPYQIAQRPCLFPPTSLLLYVASFLYWNLFPHPALQWSVTRWLHVVRGRNVRWSMELPSVYLRSALLKVISVPSA